MFYPSHLREERIESAVQNIQHQNSYDGVVFDICYMSLNSSVRTVFEDDSGAEFTMIITGANEQASYSEDDMPHYRLRIIVTFSDFDDPSPCMYIDFPDEDSQFINETG